MVEGTGLENRHAVKRIQGSNPCLSAREQYVCTKVMGYMYKHLCKYNSTRRCKSCGLFLLIANS